MNTIGSKMFQGAAIGAGIGAVGGGIAGGIVAANKIDQVPTETVTLSSYQKPLYEERIVGTNTNVNIDLKNNGGYNGANSYNVTATFPLKNPDGSVKMETIPSQTITGHGKAVFSDRLHDIREPSNIQNYTTVGDNYGNGVNVNTNTDVTYRNIGTWKEPTVKFENGVSVAGYVFGYAAAGAAAGAVGGAIVAAALAKANS